MVRRDTKKPCDPLPDTRQALNELVIVLEERWCPCLANITAGASSTSLSTIVGSLDAASTASAPPRLDPVKDLKRHAFGLWLFYSRLL